MKENSSFPHTVSFHLRICGKSRSHLFCLKLHNRSKKEHVISSGNKTICSVPYAALPTTVFRKGLSSTSMMTSFWAAAIIATVKTTEATTKSILHSSWSHLPGSMWAFYLLQTCKYHYWCDTDHSGIPPGSRWCTVLLQVSFQMACGQLPWAQWEGYTSPLLEAAKGVSNRPY